MTLPAHLRSRWRRIAARIDAWMLDAAGITLSRHPRH